MTMQCRSKALVVNVMEEMANMISASRSYDANVQVADAAKQMLSRTLTLGQR
jgi:flagellar basal-body rod protein FlgC